MRTVDKTTYKVPSAVIDLGGASAESLLSATNAMPVKDVERWSALSTATLPMPAANSLTSMANGALVISSAFDNSVIRNQRAQLYLHVNGLTAFTAGTTVDVWVIESNGTTYEDGSSSVTPGRPPDAFFFLIATSNQQELYTTVDLPPTLVKFLLRNSGGVAFDAVDANNTFEVRTYTGTHAV